MQLAQYLKPIFIFHQKGFRCKKSFLMIQWNKKKTKDSNMLSNSFKWKHYEGEIILLNVRWYLNYPLSYRNLKGMMIERGIQVDHSTIMRWVHQYSPEIEKKIRGSVAKNPKKYVNL